MTEFLISRGNPGFWRGVNHVALVTPDLDSTLAFYRDVLGMHVLFEAPANPHHGRHAMISPGGDGLGLHFFEQPDAAVFGFDGAVPSALAFVPGALQHVSFTVAVEAAGLALREALGERGVPTTPVMDQGPIRVFLFPDPSGMLLEAAWYRSSNNSPHGLTSSPSCWRSPSTSAAGGLIGYLLGSRSP